MPPSRIDVAPTTIHRGDGLESGSHVAAGIHWASVNPLPNNPIDIGLGYAYDRYGSRDDHRVLHRGGVRAPDDVHSIYLATERRIAGSKHQRTWVGGRGELGFASVGGRTRMGTGLVGRLGWEMFAGTGKRSRDILGVVAVGFFVEAGLKRLPGNQRGVTTTAGVSVRLPLIVAK